MTASKQSTHYVCQACGAVARKWAGKCEDCGEWNTLVEESASVAPKGLKPIKSGKSMGLDLHSLNAAIEAPPRYSTSIDELDRVLGGGLVAGSAILLGGDPGIGKSTLLLQTAGQLASATKQQDGLPVLYISGEESLGQIQLRARRLGLNPQSLDLAIATSVREILATIDTAKAVGDAPKLVIIDSIQTMFVDNIDAAPGTVSQVRSSAQELIRAAKKRGFSLILVGHVTKDGQIAGPRVLEHMVDTVLYFEGDRGQHYRILRAVKNRFGATDEIGVFEMADVGLREVSNPSALFLHQRDNPVSGAAVFAGLEGSRPLLIEIQALVSPSGMSTPRRSAVGFDTNRLAMILAVLESRAGMRFSDKEVFLNVAGGMRISEPAADVAAALALISALLDKPLPAQLVSFGEIGLTGEIRAVTRSDLRLKEANALGFEKALCPPSTTDKNNAGDRVAHVDGLVRYVLDSH